LGQKKKELQSNSLFTQDDSQMPDNLNEIEDLLTYYTSRQHQEEAGGDDSEDSEDIEDDEEEEEEEQEVEQEEENEEQLALVAMATAACLRIKKKAPNNALVPRDAVSS